LVRGTLRTGDRGIWTDLEPLVRELVTALLTPTGVGFDLRHVRGVPPVVNEPVSTGLLRDGIAAALGEDAVVSTEQSAGAEDFAWYLEHVPGSMCRLGVWSGDQPQHDIHQPTFDLDERALPLGVRVMVHTALAALT
jgi:metal-dependent amidase/aminoacylase/carboxypeptidase family protein